MGVFGTGDPHDVKTSGHPVQHLADALTDRVKSTSGI